MRRIQDLTPRTSEWGAEPASLRGRLLWSACLTIVSWAGRLGLLAGVGRRDWTTAGFGECKMQDLTPRFSSSRDAECGITRHHQPNDRAFARDQVLSGRLEHLAGREEDVRRRQNSRDRTKRSAPEFLEPVPTSQRFSPSGSPKFGPLYPLCSQFAYEMPFFALIQIRRPLSHRIDRIIAQ